MSEGEYNAKHVKDEDSGVSHVAIEMTQIDNGVKNADEKVSSAPASISELISFADKEDMINMYASLSHSLSHSLTHSLTQVCCLFSSYL